jgi:hypothetical protein
VAVIGFPAYLGVVSQSTSLFSFAVYPTQFIVWGSLTIGVFLTRLVYIVLGLFLLLFFWQCVFPGNRAERLNIPFAAVESWKKAKAIVASKSFWAVCLGGLVYVAVKQPYLTFGGQSLVSDQPVALIFKEDINPALWHLPIESGQPRSTRPLLLIVELSDGLMVKDLDTNVVVEVKNDMIAGVVHVRSTPTASPTPTASSTPTSTVSITPTP